jgi:hypothetical protein
VEPYADYTRDPKADTIEQANLARMHSESQRPLGPPTSTLACADVYENLPRYPRQLGIGAPGRHSRLTSLIGRLDLFRPNLVLKDMVQRPSL